MKHKLTYNKHNICISILFSLPSYRDVMDYVGTVWNTPKIIRKSESKNRDEMKERERLNHKKNILTGLQA